MTSTWTELPVVMYSVVLLWTDDSSFSCCFRMMALKQGCLTLLNASCTDLLLAFVAQILSKTDKKGKERMWEQELRIYQLWIEERSVWYLVSVLTVNGCFLFVLAVTLWSSVRGCEVRTVQWVSLWQRSHSILTLPGGEWSVHGNPATEQAFCL